MKQARPTLAEPFYVDGIGVLRCHFCLCVQAVGHLAKCPVRVEQDRQMLESARQAAPGATNANPVNPQPHPKGRLPMFPPQTGMVLKSVTFGTEVVDEETRRVVSCAFTVSPFSAQLAEALNVKSLLFDGNGLPKPAMLDAKVEIESAPQKVTLAMAPDTIGHVVLRDVVIDRALKVKAKRDRDPGVYDAVVTMHFRYPSADELFYLANGVNDQHFLTCEREQPAMDFAGKSPEQVEAGAPRLRQPGDPAIVAGDELQPGLFAEH